MLFTMLLYHTMASLYAAESSLIFTLIFRGVYGIMGKIEYNRKERGNIDMNLYDSKILLVDDNQELAVMIRDMLHRNGYNHVYCAGFFEEGFQKFCQEEPQLVILDIMLPDGDGFSLFRKMREISETPILFLSARDEDNDRLFGLGLGADDYITKPFLSQELILRVGAVLKRAYFIPAKIMREDTQDEILNLDEHQIFFRNATVTCRGNVFPLTAKELLILKKLNQNRGNIVTFDALCMAVWGDGYYGYENTLMVHIRHLREKIEDDPSSPKWIITARGLGYRLRKESEKKIPEKSKKNKEP